MNVNKNLILLLTGLLTLLLTAGCQNETPEPQQSAAKPAAAAPAAAPAQPTGWTGTVTETMDAAGYTYVEVDTGSEKIWAAGPKFSAKVGDSVVVPQGMAMENYHSKTLNRDFPVVYFVDAIMVGGAEQALTAEPTMPENHPKTDAAPLQRLT